MARPMKQVSSEPQATQMNLLRHQRTDIPPNKSKHKQFKKSRSNNMGYSNEANEQQAPYMKKEFENKKAFNPRKILKSDDRCHICGKYQCRNCHKFGHFSSLCYKKQKSYKKRSRSSKAHQLKVGPVYMQENSICSHASDNSSSDESFCLQMKLHAEEANTKYPTPQHLVTNLEFKIKPHKNKITFL